MAGRLKADRPPLVIVTCEHGGHRVPPEYAPLFAGATDDLASHRGWDPGAAECAEALAAEATRVGAAVEIDAVIATTTRLLVDLNRSIGHRRLFSEFTRGVDRATKTRILDVHYRPYRERVEACIGAAITAGRRVLHVSSHSFVPALDGVVRRADVALLLDPRREFEDRFARLWREQLVAGTPAGWRVRRNYPYRGTADGFTTALRKTYAGDLYAGLELETSQRHLLGPDRSRHIRAVAGAFGRALERWLAAAEQRDRP